jgi:hypothetical protein
MAEQRVALLELGCGLGQGHYFAAALPPSAMERLLGTGPVLGGEAAAPHTGRGATAVVTPTLSPE